MKMSKLLTAGVLFVLALAPMRAQSNGFLRVQIPFSFVAAGKELPAGDYTIQQTSESGIMIIHGASEGRTVLARCTQPTGVQGASAGSPADRRPAFTG